MALVQLCNVQKNFGPFDVLQEITADIFNKTRIGLVGPNGIGKTTLIRIITGELEEDAGSIVRQKNLKVCYLPQISTLDESKTVMQVALEGNAEIHQLEQALNHIEKRLEVATDAEINSLITEQAHILELLEHEGGYRHRANTETVLEVLGFSQQMYSLQVGCLSGGQKNRLALARTLLTHSDLYLFDEPTNFLDLQGTEWLENYLVEAEASMIIISHDRYFLNKVTTDIWEIRQGKLCCYKGNYDAYRTIREIELERQQELYDRQKMEIKRQEDFIQKVFYGVRHGQAQSRRKMLEKMERIEAPIKDGMYAPHFNMQVQNTRFEKILETENLGHAFDDKILFKGLSFTLNRGERLGVIGPNGCGKSTLMYLLIGRLTPTQGRVEVGSRVQLGFYHQELEGLVETITVFDTIKKMAATIDDKIVRDFLSRFLFRGDDIFKKVQKLSGGEKGRLALARLLWQKPNVLILDEPTNHLDILSRQALEASLQEYEGTLIFVSHDRYFIDEVATRLLVFFEKEWINFYGNYSQFQERKDRIFEEHQRKHSQTKQTAPKQNKQPASQPAPAGKKNKPRKRYTLEELEQKIIESETRLMEIGNDLARGYQKPEKIRELRQEYETMAKQLQDFNCEWENWSASQ